MISAKAEVQKPMPETRAENQLEAKWKAVFRSRLSTLFLYLPSLRDDFEQQGWSISSSI
jgi:hypothetical protein